MEVLDLIKKYDYVSATKLVDQASGEMLFETLLAFPGKHATEPWKDFIKFLIDHGADVNYDNGKPICEAVFMQELDVVKLLVANGADIHVRDDLVGQMANAYPEEDMNEYLATHGIEVVDNYCVQAIDDCIDWDAYDYYESRQKKESNKPSL